MKRYNEVILQYEKSEIMFSSRYARNTELRACSLVQTGSYWRVGSLFLIPCIAWTDPYSMPKT